MILITGATGGIGQNILKKLTSLNEDIICLHKNNINLNNLVKSKFIKYHKVNLEDEIEVLNFSEKLLFEKITIIHLAAVYVDKLIMNQTLSEFDSHYKINFRSIFIIVKTLLPKMLSLGGKVILFSSPSVYKAHVGSSAYASSKAALEIFSDVLNNEYSKFNIRSYNVKLGYYDSGMYKKLSKRVRLKLLSETNNLEFSSITELQDLILSIINDKFSDNLVRLDMSIT